MKESAGKIWIRMGKYVETGKKYSTNFSEKNLLFPIPTSVIIENSHIDRILIIDLEQFIYQFSIGILLNNH